MSIFVILYLALNDGIYPLFHFKPTLLMKQAPNIFQFLLLFLVVQTGFSQIPGTVQDADMDRDVPPAALSAPPPSGLTSIYAATGNLYLSADGGVPTSISVDKPNATCIVKQAYLMSSTVYWGSPIANGCVTLNGTGVNWDASILTQYKTYYSDVTNIVKPTIDALGAGIHNLSLTECNPYSIDGEALLVVFEDPTFDEKSIAIFWGQQASSGDNFNITLVNPLDPTDPDVVLDMGLGINFGYQQYGGYQYSIVEVNGQRISTSAGGEDDGYSSNGGLITVGGIGDSNANPVNPYAYPSNQYTDDELYTLVPFITNTTTSLTVYTNNPSYDDNIFLAYFNISGEAFVSTICPSDINVDADPALCGRIVDYTVTEGSTQVSGLPSGSLFPVGTTTNVFTNPDCTFNVTVNPVPGPNPPVCPTAETFSCAEAEALLISDFSSITTSNNAAGDCLIEITATPSSIVESFNCTGGTIDIIYTVTDNQSNTYSNLVCTHFVTGATGPSFVSPPNDTTIDCSSSTPISSPLEYTNNLPGNCLIEGTVYSTITGSPEGCGDSYTETWEVINACGFNISYSRLITVQDTTPPTFVFTNPLFEGLESGGMFLVQCEGQYENWSIPELTTDDVEVSDDCHEIVEVTIDQTELSEGDCAQDGYLKEYGYVWTATDACGNIDSVTLTMRIVDTIPPAFRNTPENITVSCGDIPDVDDDYTIYAVDQCLCSKMTVSDTIDFEGCIDEQILYRTWTATDCCGNEAYFTQEITIRDFTPPTIEVTLPNGSVISESTNFSYDCHDGGIPKEMLGIDLEHAISYDDCMGEIDLQYNFEHPGRDCDFSAGDSYRITFTSTDLCGNSAELIIGLYSVDTVAPVILNFMTEVCSDQNPYEFIAYDECTGESQIDFTERIVTSACGEMVYRDFVVTDFCGNAAYATQMVIPSNPEGPEIMELNPILENMQNEDTLTMSCSQSSQGSMTGFHMGDVLFQESCENTLTLDFTETIIEAYNCQGSHAMALVENKWSATDMCGNTRTFTALVHITDDEAPSFENVPSEITVGCDSDVTPIEAVDNCGLQIYEETKEIIAGDCPNNFSIIRTIDVADQCNNEATFVQTIHVVDQYGPEFINIPEYVCGSFELPSDALAIDLCNGDTIMPVLVKEDTLQSKLCPDRLIVQRTWEAIDACGNIATQVQTLAEPMESTPSITFAPGIEGLVGDSTIFFESNLEQMMFIRSINEQSVVAYDPCTNLILNHTFDIQTSYPENCDEAGYKVQYDYTYVFTDFCGDETTISFAIRVEDDVYPLAENVEESFHVGCEEEPDYYNLEFPIYNKINDPNNVTIVRSVSSSFVGNIKYVTVLWTLTDGCNNVSTYTQVYDVNVISQFSCDIAKLDTIYCDSHHNILHSLTFDGVAPFTYDWDIIGKQCFIMGDDNNDSLILYMGYFDVMVQLEVTDADGCVATSQVVVSCQSDFESRSNEQTSSLNELVIHEVTPNPTTQMINFTIDMPTSNEVSYAISGLDGKTIRTEHLFVNRGSQTIQSDVSDLPVGIYLLKVKAFEKQKVMKFIKIR